MIPNQIIQVITILIKGRNISKIQTLKILSNFKSESDDNCSFMSFKILILFKIVYMFMINNKQLI